MHAYCKYSAISWAKTVPKKVKKSPRDLWKSLLHYYRFCQKIITLLLTLSETDRISLTLSENDHIPINFVWKLLHSSIFCLKITTFLPTLAENDHISFDTWHWAHDFSFHKNGKLYMRPMKGFRQKPWFFIQKSPCDLWLHATYGCVFTVVGTGTLGT